MTKEFLAALILTASVPVLWGAEPVNEQHPDIGNICARALEPPLCMESYGFNCHQSRLPGKSIDAQSMGCNRDLGDGRYRFVQMLYDNGGWNVEIEKTYFPESVEPRWPEDDPSLALSSYIEQKMSKYSMHSSSGGDNARGQPQESYSGARRTDRRVAVGAACGTIVGHEYDERVLAQLMTDCERLLLRTVKRLSQPKPTGTYRVAAPAKFEWDREVVNLVSGDTGLVLEGSYEFSNVHTPCRWISDCCSSDGSIYLNSCRAPSESELQVIQTCLSEVDSLRSKEFEGCLRSAGVRIGCEEQADGSQICF